MSATKNKLPLRKPNTTAINAGLAEIGPKGMSRNQVAIRAGVHRTAVSNYLNQTGKPSAGQAKRIMEVLAALLNKDPEELYLPDTEPPPHVDPSPTCGRGAGGEGS